MASNTNQIDYAPLNAPVTSADVDAYARYSNSGKPWASIIPAGKNRKPVIVVSVIVAVWVFLLIAQSVGFKGVIWMVALGFFVRLIYKMVITHRERLAKLYKFASKNNILLKIDVVEHGLNGILFNIGHTRTIAEAYAFKNGSEIGNYTYVTGDGKNKVTHEWGYVRVPLARHLPNMVLDAKSNNLIGRLSNLPTTFSRDSRLELEGDFNKYFDLYVPKEYERDALYVFTPDVMSTLVNVGASYDMEIIDNSLMLYRGTRFDLTSEQELRQIFSIVNVLAKEIREQSDYYSDERVGDRAQNIVAAPGKRLAHKTSKTIGIIVSVAFIVFFGYQVINFIQLLLSVSRG